jgi:hypothetical protein
MKPSNLNNSRIALNMRGGTENVTPGRLRHPEDLTSFPALYPLVDGL